MKSPAIVLLATLFFSALACSSNEIGNSKDVNPETIFTDYYVTYKEGEDSVSCFLQYRFAGENGTTLVLSAPSKVSIDGKEIKAASSDFSGAYYEKKFATAIFTGDHSIAFTDINGKTRTEIFNFHRTRFVSNIVSANKQCDLVLNFENIQPEDMIEVNITDTSGTTGDMKITAKPATGKLTISAAQLQTLRSGPCTLEIVRNSSNPLQEMTTEGGRIIITHIIKEMEIELKDDDGQSMATSENQYL